MSFWSKFGKIAGIAGAGIGTLATMGAASPALAAALGSVGLGGLAGGAAGGAVGLGGKILSGVGKAAQIGTSLSPVLGGMAKGQAQGLQQETQNTIAHDQAVNQAIQQQYENQMGQVDKNASLLDLRASQARRGDLQANVQDLVIPDNARVHVPHFTGGLRPSALGPNARAAGKLLSDTALQHMNNEGLPTVPTPLTSPLPTAGIGSKLVSGAGAASSLLGGVGAGLNGLIKPKPGTPLAPVMPWDHPIPVDDEWDHAE